MSWRLFIKWKTLVGLGTSLSLLIFMFFLFYKHNLISSTPHQYLAIQGAKPAIPPISTPDATTDSYQQWKTKYVVSADESSLRVKRPENGDDTVSEGIATGMLAAVSSGDKTTFDGLWNYAKGHFNMHGLTAWHMDSQGAILDGTSATDADEDMAYALIAADMQWGGYKTDANTLLQQMSLYEVEPITNVLKPGDTWGGSDVTSPAYIATAYYPVFAAYTHDDTWDKVTQTSTALLQQLTENTPAKTTGLLPDWTTSDGKPVTIYTDKDYIYGYKSIKAVWRLGLAAQWQHDKQSMTMLTHLASFFQPMAAASIMDGYTIDGKQVGSNNFSGFIDAANIAGTITSSAKTDSFITQSDNSYYGDSYHLITLLLINHRFPHVVLTSGN